MKISSEQIQKIQDLLDKANHKFDIITNGQPLHELKGNRYTLANYYDGKRVALGEVLFTLNI